MNIKPVKPNESDCCGSGCNPCIFDVYEQQLRKYEKQQNFNETNSTVLNEIQFMPFVVTKIQNMASDILIFEFNPVKLLNDKQKTETYIVNLKKDVDYEIVMENLNISPGYYLMLRGQYINNENKIENVSRPYTPVSTDLDKYVLKIIAVIYPAGKMSQFFTRLNVNDVVFWRGPYKEYVYDTNSHQRMILFGGGTGTIPLYNISKGIVENENEETILTFIACHKSLDRFFLREELNKLQSYWNFTLNIYLTNQERTDDLNLKHNESVSFGRINECAVGKALTCNKNCLILICGCDSFNKYIYNTVLKFGVLTENIHVFR